MSLFKRKTKYCDYKIIKDNSSYIEAMELCKKAKNLIDIGCGPYPHENAKVAVDAFIDRTEHRGNGSEINIRNIEDNGIRFVKAFADNMPFKDKEFDVSITKHMIEHVNNPIETIKEIVRISEEGIIICPNIFAEYIFGRPYHLWYITQVGEILVFLKKDMKFNQPFGDLPETIDKKFYRDGRLINKRIVTDKTNPFEILLNYDNFYTGKEKFPRLAEYIQWYWNNNSQIMQVCFHWKNLIKLVVIDDNKVQYEELK